MKERVLTGIRSNGTLHLGNYLGAILPMVEIQKKHSNDKEMFFFVPDLHSFTTPTDHDSLYANTVKNLRVFAAAGMDFWNQDTYVYRQSYIPAHSELAWVLGCFTYFGELNRMTQFKDKVAQVRGDAKELKDTLEYSDAGAAGSNFVNYATGQNVSSGLFTYPTLMAADILLYDAKYVPLGEDQRQHLELTRDLGMRINMQFGNVFKEGVFRQLPLEWEKQLEFADRDQGVRIRSLRNPERKMSKSVEDPAGTINMFDDPKEAVKKIMSATTDSVGVVNLDFKNQPGVSNLLQILALLSGQHVIAVAKEWQGKSNYGDLKKAVAEKVEQFLVHFQSAFKDTDEAKILSKIEEDEKVVTKIANENLLRVQQAVGLRPRN